MKRSEIEVGKSYAAKIKSSAQAQPVICKIKITDVGAGKSRPTAEVQEAGLAAYPEDRQKALRAAGERPALVSIVELWETHTKAEKAAAIARNEERQRREAAHEAEQSERQKRVARLMVVLQGIEYVDLDGTRESLVDLVEVVWGAKTNPAGTRSITLDFLDSIADRIDALQVALVGHPGGWVESNQSDVDRLNAELSAKDEEFARLALQLKKDGYTFQDITEIAKGYSE